MTRPVPDEVPEADAIEQSRDDSEPVSDPEAPDLAGDAPPLEVGTADWQEQATAVDADADEFDRRD